MLLFALSVLMPLWDGSIPGKVWETTADENGGPEHGTSTTAQLKRKGVEIHEVEERCRCARITLATKSQSFIAGRPSFLLPPSMFIIPVQEIRVSCLHVSPAAPPTALLLLLPLPAGHVPSLCLSS